MADSYHFFMAMVPPTATQQEKKWHKAVDGKTGEERWYAYPSPAWARAQDMLMAHLEPHRPPTPIAGPVVLDVTWCFPCKGKSDGAPHVKKPDTDNLQKGLKDIMTKLGWWKDDAQVFSEHVTKLYNSIPGIRIDIEELI